MHRDSQLSTVPTDHTNVIRIRKRQSVPHHRDREKVSFNRSSGARNDSTAALTISALLRWSVGSIRTTRSTRSGWQHAKTNAVAPPEECARTSHTIEMLGFEYRAQIVHVAGPDAVVDRHGTHLAAMRANGLPIETKGETIVRPFHATNGPATIGPASRIVPHESAVCAKHAAPNATAPSHRVTSTRPH